MAHSTPRPRKTRVARDTRHKAPRTQIRQLLRQATALPIEDALDLVDLLPVAAPKPLRTR